MTSLSSASMSDLQQFSDARYTHVQALEVILGLAIKLISNSTNSIASTPLNREVEHLRREKPISREQQMKAEIAGS